MSPNGHTHRHGSRQPKQQNDSNKRPSNEKLLCTAFVSFQCFAIAQIIAAVIAGSEALLGDSFAMMVDAFTYLFNWYAERQKVLYAQKLQLHDPLLIDDENGDDDDLVATTIQELEYKKYTYQLELVPPLISVSTLIVVTIIVLKQSIKVLILDTQRDRSEQSDPNVQLMMLFSFLNLLLDVVNVGCFASAKHALGYNTKTNDDDSHEPEDEELAPIALTCSGLEEGHCIDSANGECEIEMMTQTFQSFDDEQSDTTPKQANGTKNKSSHDNHIELDGSNVTIDQRSEAINQNYDHDEDGEEYLDDIDETSPMRPSSFNRNRLDDDGSTASSVSGEENVPNLNMCSAYTHVFADTLRSLAVILASLLAEFTSTVTSEVADSTAAVVVSVLILLSLLPLFSGMVRTFQSLQRVNQQIAEQNQSLTSRFLTEND
ncbi:cation efflux protein [Nitzschia inconspicua]|uniref:Cation efflux protein n=1 Tax=Nitzschia inconspicua TaxID=303405 RepID=A0A9K3KEU3_9STRA|nr:cation efflux protein [Nitzschia inconspicua]